MSNPIIPRPLDLARTRAALAAYDAADAAIDTASDADVEAAFARADEARRALGSAYADDTADRNDRATVESFVMCAAGLSFVRHMVTGEPDPNAWR
jgi:hypothetical protein